MNVDAFSLGLGLPTPHLILEDIIARAFHTHSTAALLGGGGLLTLGFLWRVIQEKLALIRGIREPEYLGHVLMLIGCVAALSVYEPLVRGIIGVVSQLGRGLAGEADLSDAFAMRAQAFGRSLFDASSFSLFGHSDPLGMMHALLQTITVFLYGMVSWAVFALRCFQTFLLGVIIAYGPLSIGFAFLGGVFGHLALAWFWALVEVSAWGLTLDVLNFVFTPLAQDVPQQFYLITEFGLCMTLLLLIRAVPQTTSMLLRQQSAPSGNMSLGMASVIAPMVSLQRTLRTHGLGASVAAAAPHAAQAVASAPPPLAETGAHARSRATHGS